MCFNVLIQLPMLCPQPRQAYVGVPALRINGQCGCTYGARCLLQNGWLHMMQRSATGGYSSEGRWVPSQSRATPASEQQIQSGTGSPPHAQPRTGRSHAAQSSSSVGGLSAQWRQPSSEAAKAR